MAETTAEKATAFDESLRQLRGAATGANRDMTVDEDSGLITLEAAEDAGGAGGGTIVLADDTAHGGFRVTELTDANGEKAERLGRFQIKGVVTLADLLGHLREEESERELREQQLKEAEKLEKSEKEDEKAEKKRTKAAAAAADKPTSSSDR